MNARRETPIATRQAAVNMEAAGMNVTTIARILKVTKSTISRILSRHRSRNIVDNLPRKGRPRLTSSRQDKRIVRMSKADPTLTCVDIAAGLMENDNLNVSRMTIARRLSDAGLHGRRPAKKPFISAKNLRSRMEFARTHLHWTSGDWANVLFSDEKKFNLFGSDGINYVRRPSGERFNPRYTKPTVKHGGGCIMVYGAFSRNIIGPLIKISDTMTGEIYRDIIVNNVLPWARRNMSAGWILQQDNDPKHTAGIVKLGFKQHKVRLLEWPSQSPDLNPMEHLWAELERRCAKKICRNKNQKWDLLVEEWGRIPQCVIEKLIDSMPARCAAVIKSRGFPTEY